MLEILTHVAMIFGYAYIIGIFVDVLEFVFCRFYGRDSMMVLVRFPFSLPKFVKLDKNIHLSDASWNSETSEYDFSYTFYNKLSDEDAEKIISEFKKNKFLIIVQVSEDNVPFDEE